MKRNTVSIWRLINGKRNFLDDAWGSPYIYSASVLSEGIFCGLNAFRNINPTQAETKEISSHMRNHQALNREKAMMRSCGIIKIIYQTSLTWNNGCVKYAINVALEPVRSTSKEAILMNTIMARCIKKRWWQKRAVLRKPAWAGGAQNISSRHYRRKYQSRQKWKSYREKCPNRRPMSAYLRHCWGEARNVKLFWNSERGLIEKLFSLHLRKRQASPGLVAARAFCGDKKRKEYWCPGEAAVAAKRIIVPASKRSENNKPYIPLGHQNSYQAFSCKIFCSKSINSQLILSYQKNVSPSRMLRNIKKCEAL